MFQHGVERGAQFLDLGAAVAAVGAYRQPGRFGEVVRGDAAGRVRHVAEWPQAAPQHPPADHDEREQRECERDDLDRHQLLHGVVDVLHGRRGDQDHTGFDGAGAQLVGALALDVGGADEVGGARVGQCLGCGGECGVVRRRVGGRADLGGTGRDLVRGRVPAPVRLSVRVVVLLGLLGLGELDDLHLVVQLAFQVVPHVHRQRRADDGEGHERQHAEAQGQPGAEAHPAVGLPEPADHSATCRTTYPTPRTVWISGSPTSSSLRRRRLTTSSTTLERPPKPYSQTWSRIWALVSTVGDLRIR